MRYRRRAILLSELVLLLPLIAGVSIVGFQLANQAMRAHGREHRLMTDEAVMRDLVRRIQLDARQADRVTVERDDVGVTLDLVRADRTVRYEVSAYGVTRTEQVSDVPVVRYGWTLTGTRVDFAIEAVGRSPGVVWISFTTITPLNRGPAGERRLSAAAAVGRGGAS